MFLITAIKEVNKNPLSHSPPPCPPLPSVSHSCCVIPAWEWQGGTEAAGPPPVPGVVLGCSWHWDMELGMERSWAAPGLGPSCSGCSLSVVGVTRTGVPDPAHPGAAGMGHQEQPLGSELPLSHPSHPSRGGDHEQPLCLTPWGAHPTNPVLLPSQSRGWVPGRVPSPCHGSLQTWAASRTARRSRACPTGRRPSSPRPASPASRSPRSPGSGMGGRSPPAAACEHPQDPPLEPPSIPGGCISPCPPH